MMNGASILLSAVIVVSIFVRSWFDALHRSLTVCTTPDGCNMSQVIKDILVAVRIGLTTLAVLFMFLIFVEHFAIDVISLPIHMTDEEAKTIKRDGSSAIGIITAWAREWRLTAALTVAMIVTIGLVSMIMPVIKWYAEAKGLSQKETERLVKKGITAVYLYGLFSTLGFISYQVWILASMDAYSDNVVMRKC